jgi:NADH-quinone oxidoreductase subunit J
VGVLLVELMIATLGSGLKAIGTKGADISPSFGSPAGIGEALLTTYLFPFEAASLLLLVAVIGAVGLARRREGFTVGDTPLKAGEIPAVPPRGSGTMAEAAGDRPVAGFRGGDRS